MFESMMGPNGTPVMLQITGNDASIAEILGKRYVRAQLTGGNLAHSLVWSFTWNGGDSSVSFTSGTGAGQHTIGYSFELDFGPGGLTAAATSSAGGTGQFWLVSAWN